VPLSQYVNVGGSGGVTLTDNVLQLFTQYQDPTSPLFQRALLPTFPGDFERDVATGELPAVSWIMSASGIDEHPPSPLGIGEAVTSHVLSTLMSNPAVWAKTVLFVTFDENGGFFDHVSPPVAPPGTKGEWLTVATLPDAAHGVRGPIGLGFRVPMLVVSPFSRGGYVCSDTFDHTSTLRFLETRFGVEVPNLSAWRREATGDLTAALDLRHPDPTPPSLPSPVAPLLQSTECLHSVNAAFMQPVPAPVVPTSQTMPRQEPGTRPRRP
jgi:phospholipase C